MKKLLKKKLNIFGKSIPVFVIALLGVALVSAALVPFLSNTINGTVDVDSPITIEVTGVSGDSDFDSESYSVSIYGGESFTVDTTTTIHVDGVTGHIAENKIVGFDGEGIILTYTDSNYPGTVFPLPLCTAGGDSYFYIGDPSDVLDADSFDSQTTFEAALNLDPTQDLVVESRVILAADRMC